jgi:phosphatidylglycerophosphatase A
MTVKESSDELNPDVRTAEIVAEPKQPRSAKDYLALAIATWGVGYLPLAPGTWGSLVGIGVYALVRGGALTLFFGIAKPPVHDLGHIYYGVLTIEVVAVCIITLVGTWAASHTEKLSGKKDPGKVVVDEVAGQFIALIPVPMMVDTAWWSMILAFILFRFFDIVKPYPARKLESLEAGLGIMADDIVAGIYAAIGVAVAVSISWWF